MACHGAKFYKIYRLWQETLRERLERVKAQLVEVERWLSLLRERLHPARLPQTPSYRIAAQEEQLRAALRRLERAKQNLAFVERAHGVHNLAYAFDILWKVYEDLREAAATAGLPRAPEAPWKPLPYETRCYSCHLDFAAYTTEWQGYSFTHDRHALEGGLRCSTCHRDTSYRDAEHGRIEKSCQSCHPTREQLAGAEPEGCLRCHTAEIPWAGERVRFPHAGHVEMGLSCSLCHRGVTRLDHLEFLRTVETRADHELCGLCHGEEVPPGGAGDIRRCYRCHLGF